MKDILWLMKKTLHVTFRNKKNIILYLFMPLIGIFIALLAYGGGGQQTNLEVGIVDDDHSQISKDTIEFIGSLKNIELVSLKADQVNKEISSGKLDCVITFDKGFGDTVFIGEPTPIEITSIKGASVTSYLKAYLNQYIDNISTLGYVAAGDQATFNKMYHEFQRSSFTLSTKALEDTGNNTMMTNQAIGFLIMIMLISATNMSEIILLEKEKRTYFRLLSTPIDARKYILSNVFVNIIIMTIQAFLTVTIMKQIFNIGINISYWEAIFVMFLFSFVAVGLSLVIISFSNSRASASALQNFIITPTVMLSGCFWPIEVMPNSLQKVAEFLPQRWILETLTKLQEGHAFSSLTLNYVIILGFAVAFFLIAIYRFSRNNSVQSFV